MLEAIMNRRSIRKYKPDPLTDEQIKALLEAAMMAPSAKNGQPWHFVVVRDRAVIDRLRSEHPYAAMLEQAPVCVVVCAHPSSRMPEYYQQDCAAATENLLLAAYELGLGSCWMGVSPYPERMEPIMRTLGLPEGVVPFNMIAVGHPDEAPASPSRYRTSRVHYDKW